MSSSELKNNDKSFCGTAPHAALNERYIKIKRILDIICAAAAFVILLPALLIISIIIMADDFGSPVFVQDRVGKDGKIFRMYKFRTMYKGSREIRDYSNGSINIDDIHSKLANDPRITKVGRLLRAVSIDELPQLINVIKGDMSIIGPRPFIPEEQSLLPTDRLCITPGLSCYWQVTDHSHMPITEQLELDYRYIREMSFKTDIKLILSTIKVVLMQKNM